MALSVPEIKLASSILVQARNISDEKLVKFYDEFMKTSESQEKLRVLYLYLLANENQTLPVEVSTAVLATLCNPLTPRECRNACYTVLKEASPTLDLILPTVLDTPPGHLFPEILALIPLQELEISSHERISCMFQALLKEIGPSQVLPIVTFQVLNQIISYDSRVLSSQLKRTVCDYMDGFFRVSSGGSSAIPAFNTRSQVFELDGSLSKDAHTILCITREVSSSQLLSLQIFSMLRQLFPIIVAFLEANVSKSSDRVDFLNVVVEYCILLFDQAERLPLKLQDVELQSAVLKEALDILYAVCKEQQSFIPRLFPRIKRLAVLGDKANTSKLASLSTRYAAIKFIMTYGTVVSYDPLASIKTVLVEDVASCLWNSKEGLEILLFVHCCVESFPQSSILLEAYFPNILKLLAWNPVTFLTIVMEILPFLISPATSVEMFHCILDLPCVTASLILERESRNRSGAQHFISSATLAVFTAPAYLPMFNFVLRSASGQGDTFDRLGVLHDLIKELKTHPRVIAATNAVPALLRIFFECVLVLEDSSITTKLLPAMLERMSLLYMIPEGKSQVQQIISSYVAPIFTAHPNLVIVLKDELIEYIMSSTGFIQDCLGDLAFAVGQYTCTGHVTEECQPAILQQYLEAFECVLYESLANSQKSSSTLCPRVVSIMVSALAKIAARCQDLRPRILLCLTKVQQFSSSLSEDIRWSIVLTRTTELLSILQHPNISSTLLSPISDGKYWLHDCTRTPSFLKAVARFAEINLKNELFCSGPEWFSS